MNPIRTQMNAAPPIILIRLLFPHVIGWEIGETQGDYFDNCKAILEILEQKLSLAAEGWHWIEYVPLIRTEIGRDVKHQELFCPFTH